MISRTWKSEYGHLLAHLVQIGRNDAFGEGDFWLVDDDWEGGQQKICIFNPQILTKDFISNLQQFLVDMSTEAEILIQLEIKDAAPEGLRVTRSAVLEDWNLTSLRKILGNSFYR